MLVVEHKQSKPQITIKHEMAGFDTFFAFAQNYSTSGNVKL